MSKIYDAVLKLTDKFSEPLQRAEKHLDKFGRTYKETGKTLNKVSKNFTSMGNSLTKGLTLPIVGMGAFAVKSFKDVDNALDTIATKTGATGKTMKDFEKTFKDVVAKIPDDMDRIGQTIGEVNTQFGLMGDKLSGATEYFSMFTKINELDPTSAVIGTKKVMDSFGLGADKINHVLDVSSKVAQNTGAGIEELYNSVVQAAPALKNLNLNFDESINLAGQLSQSGLDFNKTMNYMSKASVVFAKDGKSLQDGLAGLQESLKGAGSDAERLTLLSKYFGTRGANFMLDAVKRGALDFASLKNISQGVGGTVAKTFEETMDPIDKLTTFWNNLKLVGNEFFKASEGIWSPILDKIISGVKKLTDYVNGMSDEQKQKIIKLLGTLALLGPTLLGVGKVTKGVSKGFFKLFDLSKNVKKAGGFIKLFTSPLGLATIGIMALIAVVILLIKNWDKIKVKAEQVFPGIGQKISTLVGHAKELFGAMVSFIGSILQKLKGVWKNAWKFLAPIVEFAMSLIKNIINTLLGVLDGIIQFLTGVFTGNWSKAWDGIIQIFSSIFGGIKESAKTILNFVIDKINKVISGFNSLKVPDWVPGLGGKGVNIPLIPTFAGGTNFFKGGFAQISERGGEIVDLPRGSRIYPHDRSVAEAYKDGLNSIGGNSINITIAKIADTVVVREEADIDRIANAFYRKLKIFKAVTI